MTTASRRAPTRKSQTDKTKELRHRIDDSLDTLARAVDEVRASETFKQYLDVPARFHRYSWHNTLLIASQRPDASQVVGYRTRPVSVGRAAERRDRLGVFVVQAKR